MDLQSSRLVSVQVVPFLLEDRLKERGAHYHKVCA